MLFSSLTFILCFLPCTLLVYYGLLRKTRLLQNYFLFATSLFFYGWGEPWFVFVMMGSIVANWGFGLLIEKHHKPWIIAAMLAVNLGIIFIFKYLMFTIANINFIFHSNIAVKEILLPIGISFFTFQAISYVLDIYRGKAAAQKNLLHVGLYISFFPQLIAGPIIRYETIALQIQDRVESWDLLSEGIRRFLLGFGKKILIANNMAIVADHCFRIVGEDGGTTALAWLGALAYTLQIFFDFSGYSDMAIGLGKMFGFQFPENFNYPYISKSASEFWRRWHISLGSWFRDYVYIPLGGSRQGKGRTLFNLFVVWLLTGFWHGANWTFICWGLLWCFFIILEKILGFEKKSYLRPLGNTPVSQKLMSTLKHLYLLLLVVVGWVLFRSETIGDAINYLNLMGGIGDQPLSDIRTLAWLKEYGWFFLAGGIFSVPWGKYIKGIPRPIYAILLALVFLVAFSYLVKGAHNPFIYFNF